MIMTNYHVVEQIAKKIDPNADTNKIKQIFASEKGGKDILLATGSPSAIRTGFNSVSRLNIAYRLYMANAYVIGYTRASM